MSTENQNTEQTPEQVLEQVVEESVSKTQQEQADHPEFNTGTRYTGQVKWFNNNLNYGFITITSPGELNQTDVFVYQINIKTSTNPYRTLEQGEYVEFNLGLADNKPGESKHRFQAIDVTGINGGSLMCDQLRRQHGSRRPHRRFNNGAGLGRGRGGSGIGSERESQEEGWNEVSRRHSAMP